MRVLHIEDRFHPEMGYQINIMAKYHNPKDEFVILTSNSLSLWKVKNEAAIFKEGDKTFEKTYNCRIIRLPAKRAKGNKYNIWLKGLKKKIYDINPNVVYVHAVESITAMRIICDRKLIHKFRIVTDTHFLYNQIHNTFKFKLFHAIQKWIVYRNINRNNILVFYTAEENRNILAQHYKIKESLIRSCLIGTDTGQYYFSQPEKMKLQEKHRFDQNSNILLYAGKHNHLKAPHLLLKAVEKIEDKINKPLHLIFIGSKDEDYFSKYMNPRFTNRYIHFHYYGVMKNDTLHTYYSLADFVVFPKENTLSALDVQACKKPVILEDDKTNRERTRQGGLVYKSGDINDLAQKILYLLYETRVKEELGYKGFQYVLKHYDYKQIIADMESELRKYVK